MKKITILGSTGSIGTQTIEVIKKQGYQIVGLSANKNSKLLEQQVRELKPKYINIIDPRAYKSIKQSLSDLSVEITCGEEYLCELSAKEEADVVVNSIVGMIGLRPTLSAINAKKDIALANKETLVTGGQLVVQAAKENNVRILPVDSEHSAIFQCLEACPDQNYLKKIILTASGGPFFNMLKGELEHVTPLDALKHPNWSMGSKITIDSATLMNKGLEFIEAIWLFGVTPDRIEIIIHRESVIHSMIEFVDNSVMAQLGVPDMKIPIQYALTYPERYESNAKPLSLIDYGKLTFFKPDERTFECLSACKKAIEIGGTMPSIVNGANEKAVEFFLNGKIRFTDIGRLVTESLNLHYKKGNYNIHDILDADQQAREFVMSNI